MNNLILFLQMLSVLFLFFGVVYVALIFVAFWMIRVMGKLEDKKENGE